MFPIPVKVRYPMKWGAAQRSFAAMSTAQLSYRSHLPPPDHGVSQTAARPEVCYPTHITMKHFNSLLILTSISLLLVSA